MSYYNQKQPPVGAPPPQGYPPEGYPTDAYPPPGYPPQGSPPPYAPYAQPPPQKQSSVPGCLGGCLAAAASWALSSERRSRRSEVKIQI